MAVTNTLSLSLKLTLFSIAVLFIAILLSLSLPHILRGVAVDVSFLSLWLRPPYVYVIFNAIIFSIAASNRLQHRRRAGAGTESFCSSKAESDPSPVQFVSGEPSAGQIKDQYGVVSFKDVDVDVASPVDESEMMEEDDVATAGDGVADVAASYGAVLVKDVDAAVTMDGSETDGSYGTVLMEDDEVDAAGDGAAEFAASYGTVLEEEGSDVGERTPVSAARSDHHRRPAGGAPQDGKVIRVSEPKEHETLDSIWKAITEGRHTSLTTHFSNSDTWKNIDHQINLLEQETTDAKKSETFKDRTNLMGLFPPRQQLLSQDELNRRAEEFINKFNEEMRLQKQQSVQQFMEMINRAA